MTKEEKQSESKCPICPKCGEKLSMATDAKCIYERFVKEDGMVSNMPPIKHSTRPSINELLPYLWCRKCEFSYKKDSNTEHIMELEEWLDEHKDCLW